MRVSRIRFKSNPYLFKMGVPLRAPKTALTILSKNIYEVVYSSRVVHPLISLPLRPKQKIGAIDKNGQYDLFYSPIKNLKLI
jgi:hypothetical protein